MPLEFLLCGIINFLFCFNHIDLGFLFTCTKSKITDTTSLIVLLKIVLLPYCRHPDSPCYIFISLNFLFVLLNAIVLLFCLYFIYSMHLYMKFMFKR